VDFEQARKRKDRERLINRSCANVRGSPESHDERCVASLACCRMEQDSQYQSMSWSVVA
jgi:hypothetical protein